MSELLYAQSLNIHEQRLLQSRALMQAQIDMWKKNPDLLKQADRKYQEYLMPREAMLELYKQRWNSGEQIGWM
jgi:hypothetical protein